MESLSVFLSTSEPKTSSSHVFPDPSSPVATRRGFRSRDYHPRLRSTNPFFHPGCRRCHGPQGWIKRIQPAVIVADLPVGPNFVSESSVPFQTIHCRRVIATFIASGTIGRVQPERQSGRVSCSYTRLVFSWTMGNLRSCNKPEALVVMV